MGLEDKIAILSSLTEVIKLMGKEYVASVKHKILSTLNTGLNIKDIPTEILINTWEAFIKTIDVQALNPILGQVIACLLQIPGDKKAVMNLCSYLVIENKSRLKLTFPQLNFIPEDFQPLSKIIRYYEVIYLSIFLNVLN